MRKNAGTLEKNAIHEIRLHINDANSILLDIQDYGATQFFRNNLEKTINAARTSLNTSIGIGAITDEDITHGLSGEISEIEIRSRRLLRQ